MTTRTVEAELLLTPAEVAALFQVDRRTLLRWANTGRLKTVRTPGGHRRYSASEVQALLARAVGRQRGPSDDGQLADVVESNVLSRPQ